MFCRLWRPGFACLIAVGGLSGLFASSASASISPTVTLTQSTTQAGTSPMSLGLNVQANGSAGDSFKDLTAILPPGLLASANIGNGACLDASAPTAGCQIGGGSITEGGTSIPADLYLVKAPAAGYLAGVAVTQHGSMTAQAEAAVSVRPTNSPDGSGLNLTLANIPAAADLTGIDITFNNIRMPDKCPSAPANVIVQADSQAVSTVQTATAPLQVTGCSSLTSSYSPGFSTAVQKDANDGNVAIATDVTETATEETSSVVQLTIPSNLTPNTSADLQDVCSPNATYSNCTVVGIAGLATPLLPVTVPGSVYLTTAGQTFALTIDFPSINTVLNGTIDLSNDSVTFSGVPDVPLTSLLVELNGGPDALFYTTCNPASDTATGRFTDQNGDKTVQVAAPFTVKGCSTTPPPPTAGKPSASHGSLDGLSSRKAHLAFRLSAGSNAPGIKSFAVKLPGGLHFVKAKLRRGVSVHGAAIKSLKLAGGRLLVTLRSASSGLTVRIARGAIAVSPQLAKRAKHKKLKRLVVHLGVTDAKGMSTALTLAFNKPH